MTVTDEDSKKLPLIQKLHPLVIQCGRFVGFVVGRMRDDQVNRVAASLSYTSTLALVPALALTLAILAAFPAFSGLRDSVLDLILTNFIPDTGMRMNEAIESFISAAGRLTTIGIVGLIVTSVLLLLTIEGAFNRIFRVARPRPIMARLVVFWTVITVSPLLVGLSFSLSGYFLTIRTLLGGAEPGPVSVLLGAAMPTILSAAAFALIYMAVPNRRVRIGDAFLGGLIAALLFALLRYGFTSFVAGMPTYQAIYGAVAALPVFLVWLFLSWNVILAGAVMTAVLPDWRRAEHERTSGPGGRLALAMDVLAALYAVAGSGAGLAQRALRQDVGVKEAALIPVLEALRAGGFAAFGDDGVWRLGRDLSRTSVSEIVHLLGYGVPLSPDLIGKSPAVARLSQVIADAQTHEKQILSQPIASLFDDQNISTAGV
ncbi:MAG: YihY family inner membrane protein [Alphaproteobacteria bacterium]|nr:YihY family inner membrane protein [Alphaproteobacteria bacterium]